MIEIIQVDNGDVSVKDEPVLGIVHLQLCYEGVSMKPNTAKALVRALESAIGRASK